MAVGFFGQYLLECGVIRNGQLMAALKAQAAVHIPVTAQILDHGVLSEAQVAELDRDGVEGARALVTAIQRGMLTFAQVEEICANTDVRPDKRLVLSEALIRAGVLTLGQARLHLAEHRRKSASPSPELDALFSRIPEKDVILPFIRTTLDLFLRYTRQVLKVVSVSPDPVKVSGLAYGFSQRVKGDRQIEYVLLLPEDLVYPVAEHIVQTDQGAIKVNMLDAVLEFVNVIVGNACSELSARRLSLSGEPPRLLTLDDLAAAPALSSVTATLQAAKGTFQVLVRFMAPGERKGS